MFLIPDHFLGFMNNFRMVVHGALEVRTLRSPVVRIWSLELLATFWMELIRRDFSGCHHVASSRSSFVLVHFEDRFDGLVTLVCRIRLFHSSFFRWLVIIEVFFWSLTTLPLRFLKSLILIPHNLVRYIDGILCPWITLIGYLIVLVLVACVDAVVVFIFRKVLGYTKSIRNSSWLISLVRDWPSLELAAIRLIFDWIRSKICLDVRHRVIQRYQ